MKKIIFFLILLSKPLYAAYYPHPDYSGIDIETGFFLEDTVVSLNKVDGRSWGRREIPENRWIQTLDNIIIPTTIEAFEELEEKRPNCKLKKFTRIDVNYNLSRYFVASIECGYIWDSSIGEWILEQ